MDGTATSQTARDAFVSGEVRLLYGISRVSTRKEGVTARKAGVTAVRDDGCRRKAGSDSLLQYKQQAKREIGKGREASVEYPPNADADTVAFGMEKGPALYSQDLKGRRAK